MHCRSCLWRHRFISKEESMKDTFDVLNDIFDNLVSDSVFPAVLGITDTSDVGLCDTKIRRSFADSTLITVDELDFIDFSFIPSNSAMNNHLVNKEVLEVNIYTSGVYKASLIYKEIHRIFKEKYKEVHCTTPCQAGCPVAGIVCYSFRAKFIVGS